VNRLLIEDNLVLRVAHRLGTKRRETQDERRSAERLLREQPELLAFLLAGTAQLAPETRSVGVFLAEVVFEVFRLAGRASRALDASSFVGALRANREMALRVGQAHDRIAERYLRNSNTLHQPALIRYITGVLLEADPTCAHEMPRGELGPLFIVLKSVIDTLDADAAAALAQTGAAESTAPA
jgi:hypothetical protein